jgi:hypothetical protein
MAIPLSWKVGGGVAAVVVGLLAWNGVSRHLAARHADDIVQEAARSAAMEEKQAQARARQRHDEIAANLQQRRNDLATNYRQIADQARQYQAAQAVRDAKERQEQREIEASYFLGSDQKCAGGIVINRQGSSFTKAIGKNGHSIKCRGDKAEEPLR